MVFVTMDDENVYRALVQPLLDKEVRERLQVYFTIKHDKKFLC
jgi:hypothetical protein